MTVRVKVFFGHLCQKHPELKGERHLSNGRCVECEKQRHKRYYELRREQVRRKQARYRRKNLPFVKAGARRYRQQNKDLISLTNRRYHEANREAALARMRKNDKIRRQRCANSPKPN